MINCKVVKEDSKMHFIGHGHANYAEYGKDIVCASVSTAIIMTLNLTERLNLSYNVLKQEVKEGEFDILVDTKNDTVKAIFNNLDSMLKELANDYPKFIKYNR